MVSLTAHGSMKADALPRVADGEVLFESAATAMYVSSRPVAEVAAETLEMLEAAGWEGGETVSTDDIRVLTLTRAGHRLTVQITRAAAQNNRTSIQYSVLEGG